MSEFIAVTGGSGGSQTVAEHTTRRVMAGDAEAGRARLVYALQKLGYTAVRQSPLPARRGRGRGAPACPRTRGAAPPSVLARTPPATGLCRSCGTENGGDARFCRH